MPNLPKLALTTGDIDGIGTEITAKALSHFLKPAHYFIFRSPQMPQSHFTSLKEHSFPLKSFTQLHEALIFSQSHSHQPYLFDLSLSSPPAQWVIDASRLCLQKKWNGLITGPLSKEQMKQDGFHQVGHTGIFRELVSTPLFMTFLGQGLNVLLLTDHIPLSEVENTLSKENLFSALKLSLKLKQQLSAQGKIQVLGLNPHNGEKGILGTFESQFLQPWLDEFNVVEVSGPIVPDTAFLPEKREQTFLNVCLYHDQGLIPFKAFHGQNSGTQHTLGLPFVRTSVDHGTAKDLFNQNKANPNSMKDSLLWAFRLNS